VSSFAVSGARGFIGTQLTTELRSRGHDVVELGRTELASTELSSVLKGSDVVVHLAGRAHVLTDSGASPNQAFQQSNVELTRVLANAASRAGIGRFVFMSSAGVLGRSSPIGGFTDESVPAPHNAYTESKLEAEMMLRSTSKVPPEVVVLRPPLVYGPGAPGNFARLIRAVASGWPLPIGGMNKPRSMVGIRNLVDLIVVASTCANAAGRTMLVADTEVTTVAELVDSISRQLGNRSRLISLPSWIVTAPLRMLGRSDDVARLTEAFELCPSIAKKCLAWSPPFSLAEELQWTISRMRQRH
jgi:nucleoside-diphosphate-sugar epimerase